jgi:hypothetical protein
VVHAKIKTVQEKTAIVQFINYLITVILPTVVYDCKICKNVKMTAFCKTTQCYIPEICNLHTCCHGDLKSDM